MNASFEGIWAEFERKTTQYCFSYFQIKLPSSTKNLL